MPKNLPEHWSSFLLDLTFNTSPKPHLRKVLPCRHIWDLLGDLVWSGKSQLTSSQRLKFHSLTLKWRGTHVNQPQVNTSTLDFSEPTHTLISCWMPEPLPPRNKCTSCFASTPKICASKEQVYGLVRPNRQYKHVMIITLITKFRYERV